MKHDLKIIFITCTMLAIIPSCGKHGAEEPSSRTNESHKAYIGTWNATGHALCGYQHGKYAIQLKIAPQGTGEMNVQLDLNKTTISEKLSDIIHLKGDWKVQDDLLQLDLKIRSWVVTDLADYRAEEEFDDFVTSITLKLENGLLIQDGFVPKINLGTTEEAREGMSMMAKGKGIILPNVQLQRQ
jgi:hypothetical protein